MRNRITAVILFVFAVLLPLTSRAEELTRIDQLREQIKATEALRDQATKPNEKARFQAQLERQQSELANLEQGLRLDQRARELEAAQTSTPQSALEELLRRFDVSVDRVKEALTANESETRQLETQRDSLIEQRVAQKTDTDKGAAAASELDERTINAREGIIALQFEHEALEEELRLAQDVRRISEPLKASTVETSVSLTQILDARSKLNDRNTQIATRSQRLANLQAKRNYRAAVFDLNRQKQAQLDEDISLLEKQTGFFNSNASVARMLNSNRSLKKYLDARLTTFAKQVLAIDRSIAALTKNSDLLANERVIIGISYQDLVDRYKRRLAVPGFVLLGMLVLYVLISRVILPLTRARETVLLSRRLSRYLFILAAVAVVVGFLFEDLRGLATAFALVSAGLVIALQDFCSSIAGWFVIIAGAKFRIGDRITVDGDSGDVLDIELLRTTILEVGRNARTDVGNGIGADHPTGRIIVLPNSFVMKSKVFNASHGHPYVWCRQVFTFTNETPFRDVEAMIHRVIDEETAADFTEARLAAAKMEKRYGVSDAEYKPKIYVRLADWGVEFSCLHACHFRKVSETQSRIHRRVEEEMLRDPRFVTAYPTQRQVTGYESLTMPELAQQQNNTAVSAVASMPSGGSANLMVSDQRSSNGNGQHSASASAEAQASPTNAPATQRVKT